MSSPLISRTGLIDTGACANVISESQSADLGTDPNVNIQQSNRKLKWPKVKLAGGQLTQVNHDVEINSNCCIKPLKKNSWYLKLQIQ